MRIPSRPAADAAVLPPNVAEHLFKRAAELDAVHRAGSQVSMLRVAAIEAGIQSDAFDAALAEMDSGGATAPTSVPRRRWPNLAIYLSVVALISAGVVTVSRLIRAPLPTVEEAFGLRCLSPGDAAALLRPTINDASTLVISPPAQHVLTVRTTPDQVERVRAILDRQDGVACQAPVER